MDEEEWPVDPDAVVVSDEPTEGLVTTPVDDETPEAAPQVAAPENETPASASPETPASETPGNETPNAETPSIAPSLDDAPTVDNEHPAVEDHAPAVDEHGLDAEAPAATTPRAEPGTAPTRSDANNSKTRRGSLIPVVVILLVSAVFGRTLVDQRDEARDVARIANHRVDEINEELEALRERIAGAIDERDDPFGDVFVDRSDDIRADALDDILGDERSELRTCVASQLTDAVAGDMPQVPLDDFDAQYTSTVQWVEEVRGLEFESVPTVRRVTQSQLAEIVGEPSSSATNAIDSRILAALGAIPSDSDLATLINAARRDTIAGLYDSETNELVIAVDDLSRALAPLELVALAHELEHALAVQQLGLPTALAAPDTDGGLAATALVEGDATLTMTRYEVGALDPVVLIGALDDGTIRAAEERLAAAPHVVRASLLFPYTDGLAFACDLEREGGNALIDAAYARAPATTAQVMWPSRYRDAQGPVDVRDMPHPGERWTEVGRSQLGAAQLRALFAAPGDDPAMALDNAHDRASAWAGSEATVWERGDDVAIGLAFAEHGDADGPTLCQSFQEWYPRAFPDDDVEDATDGLVAIGAGRVAVIRCANNTVRIGIGPDAATAAAITR